MPASKAKATFQSRKVQLIGEMTVIHFFKYPGIIEANLAPSEKVRDLVIPYLHIV
jgi:hypothetical protein